MFRAISEIAVAISVASVRLKPSRSASARACARAGTRSSSARMSTCTSSGIRRPSLDEAVEDPDRLVQVERGPQRLEVEAELDHGDCYIRLDADDHGLGPAHERCVRDGAQCPSDEGIDDVEGADVDDQTTSALLTHAPRKIVAEGHDLAIAQ